MVIIKVTSLPRRQRDQDRQTADGRRTPRCWKFLDDLERTATGPDY
jgi:hypothetical protein